METLTLECQLLNTEFPNSLHAGAILDGTAYFLGGSGSISNLCRFDFESNTWPIVDSSENESRNLQRHHLLAHSSGHLFAWGGCNRSTPASDYQKLFLAYSIANKKWIKINQSGILPLPRAGGAFVVRSSSGSNNSGSNNNSGNKCNSNISGNNSNNTISGSGNSQQLSFVCFGGYNGNYMNDMHEFVLNVESWSGVWRPVSSNSPPPPRSAVAHAYRATRDSMLVIGGVGSVGPHCEIFEYLCAQERWHEVTAVDGRQVPSRSGARAALVRDRYVMVFGDAISVPFVMFDLQRSVWSVLEFSGYDPRERNYPVVLYHQHRCSLLLHGGESCPKYTSGTCPDLCEVMLPFAHHSTAKFHDKLLEQVTLGQLADMYFTFK